MKKYVRLSCTTCKRTKDQLLDLTHYTPDKCTITFQCEGRLQPVDYISNGSSILGVAPTGVTNWYPRNSSFVTTANSSATVLRDTSTGYLKQIVLAIDEDGVGEYPSTSTVEVDFEAEQQTPQSFLKYTFKRTTPFTVLNGVEDGTAKKVLRYDITAAVPDQVEVYVNGVRRARGTAFGEYQLYDGTIGCPVPPNSVMFNTAVVGSNTQIDIIVTKEAPTSIVTLTFTRAVDDESRQSQGAWEGVSKIKMVSNGMLHLYDLFYLDFAEASQQLPRDVKLRVKEVRVLDVGSYSVPLTDVHVLLSIEQQYLYLDKIYSFTIPMSNVVGDRYMMIKYIDGDRKFLCVLDAAREVFPAISPVFFDAPAMITSGPGNDDATTLDNTYIIGPDV